jgi:hypothetical protein
MGDKKYLQLTSKLNEVAYQQPVWLRSGEEAFSRHRQRPLILTNKSRELLLPTSWWLLLLSWATFDRINQLYLLGSKLKFHAVSSPCDGFMPSK